MNEKLHYFNGIAEKTGKYLLPPMTTAELAKLARQAREPQPFLDEVEEWLDKFAEDDPRRKPVVDTERPWDLSETGWGVVYGPSVDRATKMAIGELIEYRREQVGSAKPDYLRECTYREGETTYNFLKRHGANPALAADPDRFPFYLLLVGDPASLPYQFQYELDVQYAVGRLYFERPEDYRSYVKSVIAAERRPLLPQRRLTFFGTCNEGDKATRLTKEGLIETLASTVVKPGMGWEASKVVGDDARKESLLRLLGGAETPNVLFTATHGLRLEKDDGDRLFERQGALVCQDWKGPDSGSVDASQYFSALDLSDDAIVHGLVAFFFACHSAGSPERDNFADPMHPGYARRIAPRPFVSRLPQRMLAHPRGGALAVVGHIDRAWTGSFMAGESEEGAPEGGASKAGCDVFLHCLKRLLQGHTIGYAMQHFNQAYSTLASQLEPLWQDRYWDEDAVDFEWLTWLWGTSNDARNFVLLGDPAVRILGVPEPPPDWRKLD
jgi:hypothetical protein